MLNKGLLHQKILVIDSQLSFLGSANFTRTSLLMHNNLIISIYNPDLALFLSQNTPFYSAHKKFSLPNQSLHIYLLPDSDKQALTHLKKLLLSAKKNITLCMFTLTHPDLVQELVNAKKRNLKVSIYIDKKSALGSSKKTLGFLEQHNIPILTPKGPELFHHKFAIIDHNTLVLGSTNWTKNAFSKNNDCFLILTPLLKDQKKFLKNLTHIIKKQSEKYHSQTKPIREK
jgi:phosphatidylserine/phosphatidylglycerophosphate/cardiolipin synthase-like enzyme